MKRKVACLLLTLIMTVGIGVFSVAAEPAAKIEAAQETSYKSNIIVADEENKQFDEYLTVVKKIKKPELLPVSTSITEWTGKEFYILALPREAQERGYENLVFADDRSNLTHKYAGRRVVVEKVVPVANQVHDYEIYLADKSTGENYIAFSMRESNNSLGSLEDLNKAKAVFNGGVIFARDTKLTAIVGSATNDYVPVRFGQALKVVDVWEGMATVAPLYLVVEVDGQRAAVPFSYSWTNQSINTWSKYPAWANSFFVRDPLTFKGWSQNILDKINNSEVEIGMTGAQVYYSWGMPQQFDRAQDANVARAVYGNKYLTFFNGVLTEITESEPQPTPYTTIEEGTQAYEITEEAQKNEQN